MDTMRPHRDDAGMDIGLLAVIGVIFALAGGVKGVSGLGLPTVSMALLGLVMPPAAAATLMVWPSLATNLAQCAGPRWRALCRRLWPMWAGLLCFTVFSPLPSLAGAGRGPRAALGAVLVVYGAWGLVRPALPRPARRHEAWLGALAGSLSGVLTAATGVFVLPMVPYLQSLQMDKDELIQALGLSFTVATAALAIVLWTAAPGTATPDMTASGVALLAAFAGLWAGTRLRRRMPAETFQRALYAMFVLLGIAMLFRSTP
jgi:uncharacterized membrane protein YfcA